MNVDQLIEVINGEINYHLGMIFVTIFCEFCEISEVCLNVKTFKNDTS